MFVRRRDYQRATTMLMRTYHIFKNQLKKVKRMAFISNLFVHSQYDAKEFQKQHIGKNVLNIWKELWEGIKLNETPTESMHYLYFSGIFLADIYDRLPLCMERDKVLMKLKRIVLHENDRIYSYFLKPMNNFQIDRCFPSKFCRTWSEIRPRFEEAHLLWGLGSEIVS